MDASIGGSLRDISQWYPPGNTVANRRQFKWEIDRRGLENNRQFVNAFEPVVARFIEAHESIAAINSSCSTMYEDIAKSKLFNQALITETNRLQEERHQLDQQAKIARAFLAEYQLSDEELYVLDNAIVDDLFFTAVQHIQDIRVRCHGLLSDESNTSCKSGLDILDDMSQRLELALDIVCRWAINAVRTTFAMQTSAADPDGEEPQIDPLLQQAVEILRQRPLFFSSVQSELAALRSTTLKAGFQAALTIGGGHGVMPRPIDVHIHDPLRYTSDILAWLHQTVASERELSFAIFVGFNRDYYTSLSSPDNRRRLSAHEPLSVPTDVVTHLDRVFQEVLFLLHERITQALEEETDARQCAQIASVIGFYCTTISLLLDQQSELVTSLKRLQESAFAHCQGLSDVVQEDMLAFE